MMDDKKPQDLKEQPARRQLKPIRVHYGPVQTTGGDTPSHAQDGFTFARTTR